MPEHDPSTAPIPESRTQPKKRKRLSLVWVVPIVAAIVGAWVAVTSVLGAGAKISIVFASAEGLEAGKTKIHFNGVAVGTLTTVELSEDHRSVITTAQMAPKSESFLVEDTKFWVVRPRVSGASVSGLGTLISGAYIGMEIGGSRAARREFVALKVQPVVTDESAGRYFALKTADLGSLDSGTPVYFRRVHVGEVTAYELDQDGKSLTVRVFVRAPYDRYVATNTRFWHASGLDVSFSAAGLDVQTQSFLSLMIGGIAFETPATTPIPAEAEADAVFALFSDRVAAFAQPSRDPQAFELVFNQSVRGLAVGAPVEFQGIPIGEVAEIRLQLDMATAEFTVPVIVHLDPGKLGVMLLNRDEREDLVTAHRRVIDLLVSRGLRMQLKSANLLTGALMIVGEFVPDGPPVAIDWSRVPVQLPTAPGEFEAIEASLARIVKRLDALPIEAIGENVKTAIADLDRVLLSARGTVDHVDDFVVNKLGTLPIEGIADDLRKAIADFDGTLVSARGAIDNVEELVQPNSALAGELTNTLKDVARAARDLGVLLDYLERHPEALLRGKSGEGQ